MKPPKPLTGKKLDKAIEATYYKYGHGVQVDIFDIGKIFKECATAYGASPSQETLDAAVQAAIAKYRKN